MNRNLKATVAVCAFSVSAYAISTSAQERPEFKGVPLGATLSEFRDKNPLFWCRSGDHCSLYGFDPELQCFMIEREHQLQKKPYTQSARDCYQAVSAAATYASQRADLNAQFRGGVLSGASARFVPEHFAGIVEALGSRFGPPIIKRNEVLQNRMGATFQNEIVIWRIGADSISARKYGSDVTRGSVIITSEQEHQQLKEDAEQKRKKAPGDL